MDLAGKTYQRQTLQGPFTRIISNIRKCKGIKLFFVTDALGKCARLLVPVEPLQLSLIFIKSFSGPPPSLAVTLANIRLGFTGLTMNNLVQRVRKTSESLP
jgi:hypothetical protein